MTPRKARLVLLTALLFAVMAFRLPASGAPPEQFEGSAAPRLGSHVLVKLATPDPAAAGLGQRRLEHVFGEWYRLFPLPGEKADDLLAPAGLPAADAAGAILALEPDFAVFPDAAPNDPLYGRQWHMAQIGLETAWNGATGAGVVVAILDTGVNMAGEDSPCDALIAEYDTFSNSSAPGAASDNYSHGTHVAGTAAGCADNGVGVGGVAPAAAVMAVQVLNDNGSGSDSTVAEGIIWAADHGADVINMSLGSACSANYPACASSIVNDAIAYAAAADVVIVVSAGNSNSQFAGRPGNHPDVIGVSATRYDGARASYSNYGVAIDLAAPGVQTSLDQNNDGFPDGVLQETFNNSDVWGYYYFNGTSMAAPHVAGAAALLRACAPEADRAAVRAALETNATDLGAPGWDTTYGNGFLQIDDALADLAAQYGRDPNNACAPIGSPPACFSVSATADGPGTVTVETAPDCDPDGEAPFDLTAYQQGTSVTFSAAADPDKVFTGWSGDLGGTTSPLTRTASHDLDVTGSFGDPPPPGPDVLLSLRNDGGGYGDEDVVLDANAGGLSLLFDGSAHGLAAEDVDALARLGNGTLLLSLETAVKNLPGIGAAKVAPADVISYNPNTGQYAWYFDGSDVGLTKSSENVDAIELLPDGRLLVSTTGAFKASGVNAADEDVVAFTGSLGSNNTSGTWSLYLEGSDLSSGLADVDGLAFAPGGGGLGVLYLSADATVTLGGQSMAPGDIFTCAPTSLGATTVCPGITRLYAATANGLPAGADVDAVEIEWP